MRFAACRLALAFGEADVDRFLDTIDAGQFLEWIEFLSLSAGETDGAAPVSTGPKTPEQMACILRTHFQAQTG